MRLPLSRKIFLYFAAVVIVSIASVGFFSYQQSSSHLKEQNEQHLIEIVTNAVNHTDLYLKAYERIHLALMTEPSIRKFVDEPPTDDYEIYRMNLDFKTNIVDPIFIRNPEVVAVYLLDYKDHWVYYVNQSSGVWYDTSPGFALRELDRALDDNGLLTILNTSIFTGRSNEFVTLARKIHGQVFTDFKGILALEIKTSDFSTLWKGMNLGDRGFFAIIDDFGRIVYHPDTAKLGMTIEPELLEKVKNNQLKAFTDHSFDMDRMFVSLKSAYSGWNLLVAIPIEDINKPIANIRTSSIMIGCLILIIALMLSYRLGRNLTKPIRVLIRGMSHTEQGNWIKIPVQHSKDELDELIARYNLMVGRLSELLETMYKAEMDKKDAILERQNAELQSLQLQINPHFLYNTLESIICYAAIQESEEITEIVEAIAYMFRYSVRTQIEETVIVNELKHVMNYMVIMKHRLGREFELDVRIAPQLLLMKIVRLSMQPLIENIFQHAFADGIEEYHSIWIDAYLEEEKLIIVIADNGEGIHPERLTYLQLLLDSNRLAEDIMVQSLAPSSLPSKGGIGLMNVHRRIQLVFGENYGLRIESIVEQGTRVFIVLPA